MLQQNRPGSGCLGVLSIVVALLIAVLVIVALANLFGRAARSVEHPEPLGTPAGVLVAPCPPGHAMIARVCVRR